MPFRMRLVAYAAGGGRLGALPQPLSVKVSFPFNDLGVLQASYSKHAIGGSILDRNLGAGLEIAVEVATHGTGWVEPPGARFWWKDKDANLADDYQIVQLTAPNIAGLLAKAQMWNLAALLGKGHSQAGKRPFYNASAGTIMATLMQENQDRGGVATVISRGFTTARDSSNRAWSQGVNLYLDPGQNVLYWLRNLTSQGLCDWRTAGRELDIFNPHTTMARDLADSVRLVLGKDLGDAPATSTIEDLAAKLLVRGDDGLVVTLNNPSAPKPWGAFEENLNATGVDSDASARTVAGAEFERRGRATTQYTRDLQLAETAFWPLVDYLPGDWITAPTYKAAERVRIQQITLTMDKDGLVKGNLILNDRLLDAELKRARKFAGIGGSGGSVGTGALPKPPKADDRQPAAPQNLQLTSDAYIDNKGRPQGTVFANWTVVDYATDATAMEIVGYELQYRYQGTTAWQTGPINITDTTSSFGPLTPGHVVEVRVRARGTYSTTPGAWSGVKAIVVADDVTPPPAPSKLTVSVKLGVVAVTWNGKTDQNTVMPPDFQRLDVYQEGVTTPVGVLYRETRTLQISGLPYGDQVRYRAKAIDNSGNESTYSVWSEFVTIKQLVNADIENKTINGIKIEDRTLTGTHLLAFTVTANELAVNAVTADKIDVGAVTAQKIGVGALDGKTITGATIRTAATGDRVVMNTTGIRAYDDDVETVRITGSGAITSTSVTATTIRTATTGERIVASGATLSAYTDSSTGQRARITDTAITTWNAAGDITVRLNGTTGAITANSLTRQGTSGNIAISNAAITDTTITGATVRTAATGSRIVMTASNLRTINASDTETMRITGDGIRGASITRLNSNSANVAISYATLSDCTIEATSDIANGALPATISSKTLNSCTISATSTVNNAALPATISGKTLSGCTIPASQLSGTISTSNLPSSVTNPSLPATATFTSLTVGTTAFSSVVSKINALITRVNDTYNYEMRAGYLEINSGNWAYNFSFNGSGTLVTYTTLNGNNVYVPNNLTSWGNYGGAITALT